MAAVIANETASVNGLQAKFVDVDGYRTRYYEAGDASKPGMLLCHGAGWTGSSSANTWTLCLPHLAKNFHAFAADKLASGMTDNPRTIDDYTIEAQVAHMWAFAEKMGLKDLYMVGQSRGGYLATRLTLEHQDQVRALVIVDSATLAPAVGDIEGRREKLFSGKPADPREGIRFHWSQMSFNKENITDEYVEAGASMDTAPKSVETQRVWKEGGAQRFNASLKAQKEETLRWLADGKLQVPTLLTWARDDPSAILACGLELFNLIGSHNRRTRMYITNEAGHFHYREYPKEWVRVVTDFFLNSDSIGSTSWD